MSLIFIHQHPLVFSEGGPRGVLIAQHCQLAVHTHTDMDSQLLYLKEFLVELGCSEMVSLEDYGCGTTASPTQPLLGNLEFKAHVMV